jgi:hypothetical protein
MGFDCESASDAHSAGFPDRNLTASGAGNFCHVSLPLSIWFRYVRRGRRGIIQTPETAGNRFFVFGPFGGKSVRQVRRGVRVDIHDRQIRAVTD